VNPPQRVSREDPKLTIVSGGQTGVDRAALDVALELGLACGGWCPKGRLAEDGPISERYPLRETVSDAYQERTIRNVVECDATLVLAPGLPTAGTAFTVEAARTHGRPVLVIDLDDDVTTPAEAAAWITARHVDTLNVAGPRESSSPGIRQRAKDFLLRMFGETS